MVHCRRGGNLPPATWQIQPVRVNGTTPYTEQCSGDDSSPSSPGEGLAPWDAMDTNVQRVALRPMAAGCRRYTRYVSGKLNVAAMIHRHSSPGEGLVPWDAMDTNVQRVALRPMVVLRAANQNLLIARGNHTIIPSAGCRRYSRFERKHEPPSPIMGDGGFFDKKGDKNKKTD